MAKYITVDDISRELELRLDTDTSPTKATVLKWIDEVESEIDTNTGQNWFTHTVVNEYIDCPLPLNIFMLASKPLTSVTKIEQNMGDDWNENWQEVPNTDYKILDRNTSKIMTKSYFYKSGSLRVSYEAGYSSVPKAVYDLALLLIRKKYLINRESIATGNTEYINIASVRIQSRSKDNIAFKLEILDKEIEDAYSKLGSRMKTRTKFFNVTLADPSIRFRG